MKNSKVEEFSLCRYTKWPKVLGRGASKVVYKAVDHDLGLEVAWNEIEITLESMDFKQLKDEIRFLKELDHPNIINYYDSWVDEREMKVVIITERMTSGTIKGFLKRAGRFKLKVLKNWCIQILEALQYLHSKSPPIIHRDIKCDNIFVNGTTGVVKIGDLGLCTILDQNKQHTLVGTLEFMAPELFNGSSYNEKVDIWAFGMCVLEMATHRYPFSECTSYGRLVRKIVSGEKPLGLYLIDDIEVRQFIEACIAKAEVRMSAAELLKHPFLSESVDNEKDCRFIRLYDPQEFENRLKEEGISVSKAVIDRICSEDPSPSTKEEPAPAGGPPIWNLVLSSAVPPSFCSRRRKSRQSRSFSGSSAPKMSTPKKRPSSERKEIKQTVSNIDDKGVTHLRLHLDLNHKKPAIREGSTLSSLQAQEIGLIHRHKKEIEKLNTEIERTKKQLLDKQKSELRLIRNEIRKRNKECPSEKESQNDLAEKEQKEENS
jgi:serine/threonine protein kinase